MAELVSNDQVTSAVSSDHQMQPVDASSSGAPPAKLSQATLDATPMTRMTTTTPTKMSKVTFWSLPREIRDMIWSELLIPKDDIFAANLSCICECKDVRDVQAHVRERDAMLRASGPGPLGPSKGLVFGPLLLVCEPPPIAQLCYESRQYA